MVVYSTPIEAVAPILQRVAPAILSSVIPSSQVISLCSLPVNSHVCHLIAVPSPNEDCNIEVVWQRIFQEKFARFLPQKWLLAHVQSRPEGSTRKFVDSAKVRFCCEACGHGWTSMKGRVTFWCIFSGNNGIVAFRLYGQQCDRCKGDYEHAMWYPEEITKVLTNISNRVAHIFYGCAPPPIHFNRRPGKPRTPHNTERCQACKDGVCAERR